METSVKQPGVRDSCCSWKRYLADDSFAQEKPGGLQTSMDYLSLLSLLLMPYFLCHMRTKPIFLTRGFPNFSSGPRRKHIQNAPQHASGMK